MLARLMAEGFKQVNARFDGIDARFDGVDGRLISLEKGQTEIYRRLDAIERKQDGMLLSLDETVNREEFKKLARRVSVLEEKVLTTA